MPDITKDTTLGELELELEQLNAGIAVDRDMRDGPERPLTSVNVIALGPSWDRRDVLIRKLRQSRSLPEAFAAAINELRQDLARRLANEQRLQADRDPKPENAMEVP